MDLLRNRRLLFSIYFSSGWSRYADMLQICAKFELNRFGRFKDSMSSTSKNIVLRKTHLNFENNSCENHCIRSPFDNLLYLVHTKHHISEEKPVWGKQWLYYLHCLPASRCETLVYSALYILPCCNSVIKLDPNESLCVQILHTKYYQKIQRKTDRFLSFKL